MDAAFENALRTVAEAYEQAVDRHGGKSLSRVATIVVNNGAFFQRLREGKPFLVHNLERFASWFRDPSNWPWGSIPQEAEIALRSMGRPPIVEAASCRTVRQDVACDPAPLSHRGAA